ELQADTLGVTYAAEGGWDPSGVAGMLTTLSRLDEASGSRKGVPNWLSTHPAPADRVVEIQPAIAQASAKMSGKGIVDREQFLSRCDGIMYCNSPEEGLVRSNRIVHPILRFAVTYPEGWEIQNTRAQVAAKAPGVEEYLLLQLIQNPQGSIE